MHPTSTRLLWRKKFGHSFVPILRTLLCRCGAPISTGVGGPREPAVVLDLAVFNAATWVERSEKVVPPIAAPFDQQQLFGTFNTD